MNIIKQNEEKINGVLETFDRMIINGSRVLHLAPKKIVFKS